MADSLDAALAEFTTLVERARHYRATPCVCDRSSEQAREETLVECASCHVDSLFDETMEHARGVVEFLEGMAGARPRAERPRKQKRNNVIRFQPMSKEAQPNAIWKD